MNFDTKNTTFNAKYEISNRGYPLRVGPVRENFRDTKYVEYVKYVNESTSRALLRLALYSGCGHVRQRQSRDIDSVLIMQRDTLRENHKQCCGVLDCICDTVLIKSKGRGKHPPTTLAFCPNTASVQAQFGSYT